MSHSAPLEKSPPSVASMRMLVERLLPGSSPAIVAMRAQLLDYALNPAAGNLLLSGPSGSGKSTVARLAAVLLRVAMASAVQARRIIDNLQFEPSGLISVLSLHEWYVEQSLTGLADQLAERQLFGSVKGGYTDATDTPGIFERAASGNMPGEPTAAAKLTGGVVFLDEVGDLAPALQGKLLTVLSGGSTYRLGGEGNPERAVEFHGTVITATWKQLGPEIIRADLLARISGTRIRVPGLDERRDDIETIITEVAAGVIQRIRGRIERAIIVDSAVDREFWRERKDNITCPAELVERFAGVDWSRHGNMRGLTTAVGRAIAHGADIDAILESLPSFDSEASPPPRPDSLYQRLLRRPANGDGLGEHLRALAAEDARAIHQLLKTPGMAASLAQSLGLDEQKLLRQAADLGRRRRGGGETE